MPDGYTNVFGGQNRAPAQIDYVAYTTAVDLHLEWPFLAVDGSFIAPAKLSINATSGSARILMPAANVASVGQDCLISNIGANTFTVYDTVGGAIVSLNPGTSWLVWITDNTTAAGIWKTVQFGASTSSANAAALAGAGLRANISVLDQNLFTTPLGGAYAIGVNDRATVLRNTSGVVAYSVSDAAVLGNGWFVYLVNGGSGSVTVDPFSTQTIDNAATKVYAPGESSIIFSDGSNLWTLGYGRSLVNTVTGTTINLAPSGTIVLTGPQIAAQIQNWTGTLVSNTTLDYSGAVGYWFVYNNTTGAFSVTARTGGLDAGVVVPQGTFSILRSDGTNMKVAFTATTGTVTSVATTAGELTGGPITTTGTLGLANTAVAPAAYGDATHYPTFTVDAKGRLTAAAQVALGTGAFATTGAAAGNVPVLNASGLVAPESGGVPTGSTFNFSLNTLPAGYIWAVGTIGSAASGATNRANADTLNLYTAIYNSWPNTTAPVSGGRGANAAVDFAANKTIAVADYRGRMMIGRDSMGGFPAAGRVTNLTANPDGVTLGAVGGAQTQVVNVVITSVTGNVGTTGTTVANVSGFPNGPVFGASAGAGIYNDNSHTHDIPALTLSATSNFAFTAGAGVTSPFDKMDPFLITNVIIKL